MRWYSIEKRMECDATGVGTHDYTTTGRMIGTGSSKLVMCFLTLFLDLS